MKSGKKITGDHFKHGIKKGKHLVFAFKFLTH